MLTILNEMFLRVWRDDRGQDIAEYAFMLAVILVVTLVAVMAIGNNASSVFSTIAQTLANVLAG